MTEAQTPLSSSSCSHCHLSRFRNNIPLMFSTSNADCLMKKQKIRQSQLIFCSRFSPTRTPSPWDGVRVSDLPGPSCPQKLLDLEDERILLEKMPKGRLDYLKRLMPYLKNQSEDCLYLNIFAPLQSKYKQNNLIILIKVRRNYLAKFL